MRSFYIEEAARFIRLLRSLLCCWLGAAVLSPLATRGVEAEETSIQPLPPVDRHAVQQVSYHDTLMIEDEAEPTLEERVAELEDNYSDLSDKHAEALKKLKITSYSGHSGATMKVNGRVHFDHWGFPESSSGINVFENNDPAITPQDRIGFRRVRFGV